MHNHNHNADIDINNEEELLALIKYMLNHNISHTKELEELSSKCGDNEEILKAIASYKEGNDYLAKAIEGMDK